MHNLPLPLKVLILTGGVALAGCGANKENTSAEPVAGSGGVAVKVDVKANNEPVATSTPAAESTPSGGASQDLCAVEGWTWDGQVIKPNHTVADTLKDWNADEVNGVDVTTELDHAQVLAGPDVDEEKPVSADQELAAGTKVHVDFTGVCND